MPPYNLVPKLSIFGAVKRIHISYSNRRLNTADIARRLVVYATGKELKLKYPLLNVTWEILDYDTPANLQVEYLDGKTERFLIEGYSKREQEKIINDWQFESDLVPYPETLAPKFEKKEV
ncbi:hypothetical protein MACJ_003814 [Theileria orientalis]|uniref:Uncharacterized protein n=1 Tax=Theileria orientalis TaxID=68886 RepID=A0A976XJV6_THEOR|nr:hypothetical protein MACJ_003814 [Theileria orientalis]